MDFRSVDYNWEQAVRVAEYNGRRNALVVAGGLLLLTAAGVALAARLRRVPPLADRGGSR